MAKGFKSNSCYSDELGNADAFRRDTSFFDKSQRAGEGPDNSRPKLDKDYAGGMSDNRRPVDPSLKFSGGNSGCQDKGPKVDENWMWDK